MESILSAALISPPDSFAPTPSPTPTQWQRTLTAYSESIAWRSVAQLVGNLAGFFGLGFGMWLFAERAYWVSLALALPAAGFLLRLFSIQHDCGHGAFFRSRAANDWIGRVLGVLTLVPYAYWRSAHATHHATIGRLDRRGIGEIDVLTAREYQSKSWLGRVAYRAYRHPLVLLGIGPSFQFYVRFRLPFNLPEPATEARNSILLMNVALLAIGLGIHGTLGLGDFLWIYLPPMTLAAGVGIALFYVHHNFEETYWAEPPDWRHRDASLEGSSYYDLPAFLQWFVGHTGIHHVHHLCPRIPNYRLNECIRKHPELADVNRLSLGDLFRCIRLGLWDEARGRLVSFAEAKRFRE